MVRSESMTPCRTCTDFKSWSKQMSMPSTGKEGQQKAHRTDCPLDKNELGRSTWGFLHTMAAHYPESPSQEEVRDMKNFFSLLSRFYPCEYCAKDLRDELKVDPPKAKTQSELSQWLCRLHNKVNVKLGKKEFDCAKVNERWRDGWLDGSCD
ncbi:FAD-linked sulfhydryl oxidase ALR [Phlebotomus argentipes]|uniref:FAD-linked sulfhydryl oxidase ALR n=1 Tax=Phlebotomus argentipes TaxID=94469 RepID=UPI002892FC88|nr:FAD-linked sulfhydryl oxidase ALR [Phlebotomus argentipes]